MAIKAVHMKINEADKEVIRRVAEYDKRSMVSELVWLARRRLGEILAETEKETGENNSV